MGWPVAAVVGVTALVAVAATPSFPSLAAATPECVPDRDLPAANALVTCVENVTWIGGPGVFGLLVLAGAGTEAAVLVAAVPTGVRAGPGGSPTGCVRATRRPRACPRCWAGRCSSPPPVSRSGWEPCCSS